jgi:demethylmenaquinone methyltransferase / 2-methoxy-6-polyprenyl-1,4-benzoquinol methylase
MASYPDAVREMSRVLKSGGHLHVLDFSVPTTPIVRPVYRLYLHHVLPRLAGLMTGAPDAYEYLGGSIEAFPSGMRMCELFLANGFSAASGKAYSMGIATHYEGTNS